MNTSIIANRWKLRHGALVCLDRPAVMGILNVTPDSFSDGGRFQRVDNALRRADEMVADGAGIIDIGPESTRPGSDPVTAKEQIDRMRPVVKGVRRNHADLPVSIDTRLASVAAEAIDLGADIINDVSALRYDPSMVDVVRSAGVPIILMHARGEPKTMQSDSTNLQYDDVVDTVIEFFDERITFAESAGVTRAQLAVDPGIGFGKTTDHNCQLLREIVRLKKWGLPIVIGASRKRFIGELLGQTNACERVTGSIACAVAAVLAGASIVRAHDVRETVDAVRMAHAIQSASDPTQRAGDAV